jgi:asparagine synthetase B (glutamine-hydrolysing)
MVLSGEGADEVLEVICILAYYRFQKKLWRVQKLFTADLLSADNLHGSDWRLEYRFWNKDFLDVAMRWSKQPKTYDGKKLYWEKRLLEAPRGRSLWAKRAVFWWSGIWIGLIN